jgi:hypothetical protein
VAGALLDAFDCPKRSELDTLFEIQLHIGAAESAERTLERAAEATVTEWDLRSVYRRCVRSTGGRCRGVSRVAWLLRETRLGFKRP